MSPAGLALRRRGGSLPWSLARNGEILTVMRARAFYLCYSKLISLSLGTPPIGSAGRKVWDPLAGTTTRLAVPRSSPSANGFRIANRPSAVAYLHVRHAWANQNEMKSLAVFSAWIHSRDARREDRDWWLPGRVSLFVKWSENVPKEMVVQPRDLLLISFFFAGK